MAVTVGRAAPTRLRAAAHGRLTASPRYRWIVLVSVLLGLLSVNITFTIFNVALVRIAQDLHTTQNELTWAITGPLLLVGVAAPMAGKIGDLRGHRRLYLFGLSGALLCAVLTASAPSGRLADRRPVAVGHRGRMHHGGLVVAPLPRVPTRGPHQGARLVVARRCRRPGARRGARGPGDRGLRLAIDLHRAGAADRDRPAGQLRRAVRDRADPGPAARRRPARSCWLSASAACCSG